MSGSERTSHASCRCRRIRELNDALRIRHSGGRLMMTPGVDALGSAALVTILTALKRFTQFDSGNDPYAEHDMGSINVGSATVLWKIDYYDQTLSYGSPDPADPSVTLRVMTIMLAEEY